MVNMKDSSHANNITEVYSEDGHTLWGSTVAALYERKMLIGTISHKLLYCEVCSLWPKRQTNHNDPKFSDRQVWANSVDSDQTAPEWSITRVQEQSDQGQHCLPFGEELLDAFRYMGKSLCSNFRIITAFSVVQIWAASWQNQQNGMCAQRRLRSACASAQYDQSLHCPHEESLGP